MQPKLPRTLACRGLLALACVLGFPAAPALAQGPPPDGTQLDRARAAYDRGVRAHAARDYVIAARAFAEADALAPQPASLEAALEAAMRADDALLGAELVDRAEGRGGDPGVARTLVAARKRFEGRTGKVRVDCRAEARCVAAVDGSPADARRLIYVIAGPHAVVVHRGDDRIEDLLEVKADATVVVGSLSSAPTGAPATGGSPAPVRGTPGTESQKLAPVWFFVGVGVTAVFAAGTVMSGLDAVTKHDRFKGNGCGIDAAGPRPADCDQQGKEGSSAQLRTNVLLGSTVLLAAATTALGIFAVRWSNGTRASLVLGTQRSAAMAGLELVTP